LQRRLQPARRVGQVLQGIIFVSETLRGSDAVYGSAPDQASDAVQEILTSPFALGTTAGGVDGVPLAVLGGAIRVSTPFLFVSLGECITERAGASTSASKARW
jgi:hypothetical protein